MALIIMLDLGGQVRLKRSDNPDKRAELTLASPDDDRMSVDLSRDDCRTLADALHAIAGGLQP